MNVKPRIFIGSSSEGLKVAKYVKSYFANDFECFLWTDDIFKYNESVFDTLLKSASLFDFGIMVATKDDFTVSRNTNFDTPRDNIVFEYGLFLGRVGAGKAFVLQEEGTKLPTDLFGITTPRFVLADNLLQAEKLNDELRKIGNSMKEKMKIGELGLLPSTALAIGYYENFVALSCEALIAKGELQVGGKVFKKFEFNIVIPNDLDGDVKKKAKIFCTKLGLKEAKIETSGRGYPIWVTYKEGDDVLKIYDMPPTINGIDKAIEMYMKKGHIGKTTEQKLLEERELRNFKNVIQLLIDNDAYCKHLVRFVDENQEFF
ncbi:STING domain-containing protein [Pedobacter sp. SL55]|uniref:CBASS system CD-NTase-associated NAD(+) hydrolase Cap12 n=1 Tax=Pedobacter sp. SL55 TaxID=2995161 RepID=UPI00226FAFE4|nr:STING domain-containing protein [Pedobacter sp. SL55]WAC39869.1 nucleotide-binding protein [Pedobacter sp. SL55]